jgi:hypothetical protein
MMKISDEPRLGRQHSTTALWISKILVSLLAAILLESVCLGIIYLNDSLKGKDTSLFFEEHILTKPFVSDPAGPVPGKHFLGRLTPDNPRGWAQFLVPDALLGWRLGKNISAYFWDEYLSVTDSNGFIVDVDDPPVAPQKSANVYRVIVLGGSTVMGVGAPRPSQNIVGMLRMGVRERELSGPNGRHVEFINAGVSGFTSAQEYLYFVSDLLRFTPDLVIVYDGVNDSHYQIFYDKNGSPFRTATHDEITRRAEMSYSIKGSVLLAAENLKYKLGMIELPRRFFARVLANLSSNTEAKPLHFDTKQQLLYYKITRRAFLDLADPLSVALFLQPWVGSGRALSDEERASSRSHNEGDPDFENRFAFYKFARRVLVELKEEKHEKSHACIVDISDSLKGVSQTVYVDSAHMLPTGNKIVAARILDELVSCGFLERPGG